MIARHKDSSTVPVDLPIGGFSDKRTHYFIGHLRDISQRKETMQTLYDLSARLINASESERKRMARELHDDLSQELALIAVEIELLSQYPPNHRNKIARKLTQIQRMARDASSAVRRISNDLHPVMLDQLGLAAAIAAYCNEISARQETKIDFKDLGAPVDIVADVSLCFYRVLQESIRNALKHSGSNKIIVRLFPEGRKICLLVRDEGRGFDMDSLAAHGLGLTSMKERMRLIQGTLDISSRPGKGTTVTACQMLRRSPL